MSGISYLNDFQLNAAKNRDSQNSFFNKKRNYNERYIGSSFHLPDQKSSRCFSFLI